MVKAIQRKRSVLLNFTLFAVLVAAMVVWTGTANAGLASCTVSLGDLVWNLDSGHGIAGVEVALYAVEVDTENPIHRTFTDVNGKYTIIFEDKLFPSEAPEYSICPGTYIVKVNPDQDPLTGLTQSVPTAPNFYEFVVYEDFPFFDTVDFDFGFASASCPNLDDVIIWPPNHKEVEIATLWIHEDIVLDNLEVENIYQDEPIDTYGDGNTTENDAAPGVDGDGWIRAERSGTKKVPGDGRVYFIKFNATTIDGGVCDYDVKVGVPHDNKDDFPGKMGGNGQLLPSCTDENSPQLLYNSTNPCRALDCRGAASCEACIADAENREITDLCTD